MYYLRIGFHPFKNDGMESAEKKVRIFLGTARKLFDTSLLFYLPDFRETTPGNWLPCGVFWVFWHCEIWASDTFKRIQKNASPKLTRNDEWRTRHAREFGDIPLALSGNLLTAPPTRVDRIMRDGYLERCKLYSVNFVEIFMKICIKIAFRPSAPP